MIYLITGQLELYTPAGYSMATVEEALEYLNNLEVIAYDSETTGFDPYLTELISIQLGNEEKQYVIDTNTINISLFKTLLETKELIMHNAKFDLKFLYHKKIVPTKIFEFTSQTKGQSLNPSNPTFQFKLPEQSNEYNVSVAKQTFPALSMVGVFELKQETS